MIQTMIGYGLRAGLLSWYITFNFKLRVIPDWCFQHGIYYLGSFGELLFASDTVGAETSAQVVNMQTSLAYIAVYLIDARRKSYHHI